MRKIKSNFFISLDNVVESPDKWHFPYFDDEMGAAVGAGFAGSDAMLMGRVLYEEWAAYWPENADQPFGDVINPMKKYVVSSSLTSADWENTEVLARGRRRGAARRDQGAGRRRHLHVGQRDDGAVAAARGAAGRAQPAGAPDRGRRRPGAAVPGR